MTELKVQAVQHPTPPEAPAVRVSVSLQSDTGSARAGVRFIQADTWPELITLAGEGTGDHFANTLSVPAGDAEQATEGVAGSKACFIDNVTVTSANIIDAAVEALERHATADGASLVVHRSGGWKKTSDDDDDDSSDMTESVRAAAIDALTRRGYMQWGTTDVYLRRTRERGNTDGRDS